MERGRAIYIGVLAGADFYALLFDWASHTHCLRGHTTDWNRRASLQHLMDALLSDPELLGYPLKGPTLLPQRGDDSVLSGIDLRVRMGMFEEEPIPVTSDIPNLTTRGTSVSFDQDRQECGQKVLRTSDQFFRWQSPADSSGRADRKEAMKYDT